MDSQLTTNWLARPGLFGIMEIIIKEKLRIIKLMARELCLKMEFAIREISLTTTLKEMGLKAPRSIIFKASIITEQEFMENLRGICRKISQLSMKVDSLTNNLTEKEYYQIKSEITKGRFKMGKKKVEEFSHGKMEIGSKEITTVT